MEHHAQGDPLGPSFVYFFILLRTALKDRPKGPSTANRQPPTANRQHMVCPWAFLGNLGTGTLLLFFFVEDRPDHAGESGVLDRTLCRYLTGLMWGQRLYRD